MEYDEYEPEPTLKERAIMMAWKMRSPRDSCIIDRRGARLIFLVLSMFAPPYIKPVPVIFLLMALPNIRNAKFTTLVNRPTAVARLNWGAPVVGAIRWYT